MKRYIFELIVCLSVFCIFNTSAQTSIHFVQETIKTHVKSRIDNRYSVGTVVAFFENGKETYFTYGYANADKKQVILPQSVFEIGSISKTFTSLLLADLVQKKAIRLDDFVEKYLPDSVKIPSFNGRKITFADLATHTSGLPRMPTNIVAKDPENPYVEYGVKELYAFLKTAQLENGMGNYNYSNVGVGLLGHVLTRISGKSYEQLLQNVICNPLKMNETSTLNSSSWLTTGHVDNKPVSHWDFDIMAGAGAIRSNAEDLMRYLRAELDLSAGALASAIKQSQQPLYVVDSTLKMALGWHISAAANDEIYWHNGGTGGYRTFAGFSQKSNKAIVILNNSTQSVDDLGMYFFNPSVTIIPSKKSLTLPKLAMQSFVGKYKIDPKLELEITLDNNQLFAKLTGESIVPVYPETVTKLFCREVNATIDFFRNDKGEFDKLILDLNGDKMPATRK
ncbi:serine hydrolase [Runella sp. CRIBMP]|uniref:serine hydrolase n=1 Tax=Runella sp. CRIBMP TaxID=2683261 RepID=UPI001412D40C|nr:serine hydrolase [Runella sp. CRIBMP]NBB18965.1 serine hydrolase [Runella sp. CRIBMP]